MMTIDNAYTLISQNAARLDTSRLGGENIAVTMELTGSGGGVMSAALRDRKISVRRGYVDNPDCVITLSCGDFERIINQTLSPAAAIFSGRIRVRGDLNPLLRLQEVLGF